MPPMKWRWPLSSPVRSLSPIFRHWSRILSTANCPRRLPASTTFLLSMPRRACGRPRYWSLHNVIETVPWWMWILGFLLVLGPLVTVHELGHYLVGRWFGVKADVFSIGFGKELAGYTDQRGTRWKLSAIPLGGYVQFAGDMNPASQPSETWLALPERDRARTFQAKPLWQRALIVAAGPLTNLLVAIVIFAAINLAF